MSNDKKTGMSIVQILYADGSVRVEAEKSAIIIAAAHYEVDLHNREFPDDPWSVKIIDETA